jgi:dipeptidyl-peptidase-4
MKLDSPKLISLSLLLVTATLIAQSPRDAMFYQALGFGAMVKGGFIQPHWMENGNSFWWAEGDGIYKYDPIDRKKSPLFDTARLRSALAQRLGHKLPGTALPFSRFTFLPGEKAAHFSYEGRDFILQTDSYALEPAPTESQAAKDRRAPHFVRNAQMAGPPPMYETASPDGRWFAGDKDGNLYLRSTLDGHTEALTDDGIQDFGWDAARVLWSPDSLSLTAVKKDQRNVPWYPIVHWLKPIEEVELVHFDNRSSPERKTESYVIDVVSKKRVRVYGGFRAWRQDGSELLMNSNQGHRKFDFVAFNPKTGATRSLFTETTETFFDGATFAQNSPNFTPLSDNRRFLWLSERDGWNQIYLYDFDGTLIRKLTEGSRPVVHIIAVDEKAGWVYYTAHGAEGRPYDFHLYRVNLSGGPSARLTEAPGQHDQSVYQSYLGVRGEGIQFSPSRQFFLDSHSDVNRPPQTELRRADGTLVEVISKANADAVMDLRPNPPEEFTVKAADGKTDLYGVLYKPYDFDPSKKYPVLDSIYAGPQTTWVPRRFTADPRGQAFAHLGFIVFVVDARGTPDRGKAFQDVVYRNFGRNEIPDHVATLNQLAAKRPFMDLSRVGVFGGSWGGYFAIRALLQAPEVFHVGVAQAPVTDLRQVNHDIYMGRPEENKEGYDFGSNLLLAGKLKGHLLLIHGTSDLNAPFSATIQMIDALVQAGKPYDLIVLPEQTHRPEGPSKMYSMDAHKRYLVDHLKP